ncbi:hypothetical protein FQN60_010521 [Etheostoma spectabile]|uniref:Uncharacterized protein n=1 Tax=Etheostoma spectabile TaxID=54343 RepID=A0A5J5D969_9PERO|nr:hypothetical protein FQN60_010521 [Etheostoma spectabile]
MLQFVLEFATTKPSSVSPAEDLKPTSPTLANHPLIASGPPYTSPLHSADTPLTAHPTQPHTASLKKSCTLLRLAYSDGGPK